MANFKQQPGSRGETSGPRFLDKMTRCTQFLVGLLMVPAICLADNGVEILMPQGHISTSVPTFHIVGRTTDKEVSVELNGNFVTRSTAQDSIFHVCITIPFGLNQIVVRPMSGSEADSTQGAMIEVLCGPRIPKSFSNIYVPHEFHGLNVPTACLGCHSPGETTGNSNPDWDWCISCHGPTGRKFTKHINKQDGSCKVCHDISDNMTRSLSGDYSDLNPCYGCHDDKIGQYAQDFIHGPVSGGSCTICHNPHGSDFEMNLRSPVPFLCMYCHTAMEESNARVQHKPFADGQCTKCHDPHATENRWVLLKSTGEICLVCHEDNLENHRHRYEVKPRHKLESDLVLNQWGRLECLTCHAPHATDAEHLLKTDEQNPCVGCHPGHM
jgi:predicted CXXCH cytochrome family protein